MLVYEDISLKPLPCNNLYLLNYARSLLTSLTYFRKCRTFCTSFSQMHFPNTKTDYPHGASRLLTMVQTATPVPPPSASIGSFVLLQHAHGGPDWRDCCPWPRQGCTGSWCFWSSPLDGPYEEFLHVLAKIFKFSFPSSPQSSANVKIWVICHATC